MALPRWPLAGGSPGGQHALRLGSAASAIGAALTRSASVTLVAALALLWVLRRQWRAFVALSVAAALTVGPWLVWTVVAPHKVAGRSYIAGCDAADTRSSTAATAGW